MEDAEIKQHVQDALNKREEQNAYNPSLVPGHSHTGQDSARVDYNDLKNKPTIITSPVSVPNGGTGQTTLTAHNVLVGNDASGIVQVGPGITAGYVLTSNGASADPSFQILPASDALFGAGADGAIAISSGTTTLSLGGAAIFEREYTSISITGTGQLAFSNPHANGTKIILRVQGNVTLTATAPCINASGMGAAGGTGGSDAGVNPNETSDGTDGTAGTAGMGVLDSGTHLGGAGTKGTGAPAQGTGGTGGVAYTLSGSQYYTNTDYYVSEGRIMLFTGAGGGGGATGSVQTSGGSGVAQRGPAGSGGNGGPALIITCGGNWNFTTALGISVAGANGGNATAISNISGNSGIAGAGGGGGGGGGSCLVLYNALTANSGTINTAGGTGGTGSNSSKSGAPGAISCSGGAGGAGGGSTGGAGGNGANGGNAVTGSNAGGARAGAGGGGGGDISAGTAHNGGTGGTAGSSVNEFVSLAKYYP